MFTVYADKDNLILGEAPSGLEIIEKIGTYAYENCQRYKTKSDIPSGSIEFWAGVWTQEVKTNDGFCLLCMPAREFVACRNFRGSCIKVLSTRVNLISLVI